MEQIPERYRNTFVEGYHRAGVESSPVRLKGMLHYDPTVELYRAVFMPIMLHTNWSKQLIFGSFNLRFVEQPG